MTIFSIIIFCNSMHDTLVGVASRAHDHARALMSVHSLDFISHQSTYMEKR